MNIQTLHTMVRPFTSITGVNQFDYTFSEEFTIGRGITDAWIEFVPGTFLINVSVNFAFANIVDDFLSRDGYVVFAGREVRGLGKSDSSAVAVLALNEVDYNRTRDLFVKDKSITIF